MVTMAEMTTCTQENQVSKLQVIKPDVGVAASFWPTKTITDAGAGIISGSGRVD